MDEVAINYEKFRYSYHDPDMIFGFLEEQEEDFPVSSYESSIDRESVSVDEEDDEKNSNADDERKAFWESQEELLQTTLYRTTSFEAKVRHAAKDALRELNSVGVHCSCRRTVADNCRRCKQKEISVQLQNAGFSCVMCISNWKTSPQIPAGQHTYLEVVQNTGSKKGEMKVIIELNFRAEFEMARSSQEYKNLITKLPEVFVGKVERLQNLVKILCAASKKCMKERRMYMAPWRKHKYMQAKWRGTPLPQAAPPSVAVERPTAPPKQRTSILTFDFADTLHHTKAVEVI